MRFELTIDCDNAAFADDETGEIDDYSAAREIANILSHARNRILDGDLTIAYGVRPGHVRNLHDGNGNLVGQFVLRDTEE